MEQRLCGSKFTEGARHKCHVSARHLKNKTAEAVLLDEACFFESGVCAALLDGLQGASRDNEVK